jgi:hypothetical protein
MYVVERFAAFAEASRRAPIAPEVLHHAKRAVIDWYAALLPGAVVPPATALERALADELDRGEARLALGRPATIRAAALVNGSAKLVGAFAGLARRVQTGFLYSYAFWMVIGLALLLLWSLRNLLPMGLIPGAGS